MKFLPKGKVIVSLVTEGFPEWEIFALSLSVALGRFVCLGRGCVYSLMVFVSDPVHTLILRLDSAC